MSIGTGVSFNDTESLSAALAHTDVSAVQLNAGSFGARLDQRKVDGWTLQFIEFHEGVSSCAGSAARDRHAFVIPLTVGGNCRLLGRELADTDVGIYAPGSEHADVSTSGLTEIVLTPPAELLEQAVGQGERLALPSSGSHVRKVPSLELQVLQRTLSAGMACPSEIAADAEAGRGLASDLEVALLTMLTAASDVPTIGRLPRPAVLRMVQELLEQGDIEPVHASDLARLTGVSYPTLRRIFLEWFGISPLQYLFLKRLYLSRRRLLSGEYATVSEAATSCGFWELGRFAQRYRILFGELPSDTLKSVPKDTKQPTSRM